MPTDQSPPPALPQAKLTRALIVIAPHIERFRRPRPSMSGSSRPAEHATVPGICLGVPLLNSPNPLPPFESPWLIASAGVLSAAPRFPPLGLARRRPPHTSPGMACAALTGRNRATLNKSGNSSQRTVSHKAAARDRLLGSKPVIRTEGGGPNRLAESGWFSQRIEDIEARKVFFIVRYNHALVCLGDGSDNHIQVASGFSCSAAFRHEASPDQCGLLVKRQYPAFE